MTVLETSRLRLRRLEAADAEFMYALMNDPAWLRYIGDRGIRTVDDARANIANGAVAMYARVGFGLYLVELRETAVPIGICGPIRRDNLEDVDLGFAFLPQFAGQGFAFEAASASLAHCRDELALRRLVAITLGENHRSIRLLEKLGFAYEKEMWLTPTAEPVRLYGRSLESTPR